jgi:ferritin
MKISNKIESLINEQINHEFGAQMQYLAMAAWFIDRELTGLGNFFTVQAEEENMHAMKHISYLLNVGGKLELKGITAPKAEFDSPLSVFRTALEHEQQVTRSIYNLIDSALQEKDFATYTFLEWFVQEQVEEEATMRHFCAKFELIGDDKTALFFLDEEMSKRKTETGNAI